MKKMIFILNLTLAFQLFAEEREIDYASYVDIINADPLWTKDIQGIVDVFAYDAGNCEDIDRITIKIGNPGKNANEDKFIQAMQNKMASYMKKAFKNVMEYEAVGVCHLGDQYFSLLKKSNWWRDSWIARQVIIYTGTSPKDMQVEFARTLYGSSVNEKHKLDKWYDYDERRKHVVTICNIIKQNLGSERVIKECRAQIAAEK